jgi:predicted transcriptional regulator of viral defense system
MKFEELLGLVGALPWFDLAAVVQLAGEQRKTVLQQLHRFSKTGRIVPLRRGIYAVAEPYRRAVVQPAELAGALYRPSYLSERWALSFHGIIPEGVPVHTSVTTRATKRFDNEFGQFVYRTVKQPLFFGYEPLHLMGRRVNVATKEKALVDLWHLDAGEWTVERTREMRFSASEVVSKARLGDLVTRLGKPRIERAYRAFCAVMAEEEADFGDER